VLGDMGEVGDQGPGFHDEAGSYARERGIEQVFTLGELAAHAKARHFGDVDALNAAVLGALDSSESVLVKGSRFMKMERVVQAIVAHAEERSQGDRA
jgi:UDP-N-acetylmuramoyl-tripeptide--D-alanyl-D-alanine ligase